MSATGRLASSVDPVLLAATLPMALLSLAFVAYCLVDLRRSPVKHLPKWAWAAACVLSVPLGGIAYLLVGRDHR